MFGTFFRALVALLCLGLLTAPVAWADDDDDDGDDAAELTEEFSEDLQHEVSLRNVRRHQREWQRIADRNGGTRASATPGYDESVDYVVRRLERAGYVVTRQEFRFTNFVERSLAEFEQTAPNPTVYEVANTGFRTMSYSGSGDVTELIETVDILDVTAPSGNSGCDAADFVGFVPNRIALIRRGGCSFFEKASRAQTAGAVGVIVFNNGDPTTVDDRINGTLTPDAVTGRQDDNSPDFLDPVDIPVIGTTSNIGWSLVFSAETQDVEVRLFVDGQRNIDVPTENVLADTFTGNPAQTIVVGAHLDSVFAGPGINDNGSGSAAILETALQLARYDRVGDDDDDDDDDGHEIVNRVRFAWWGAEESGLLGSEFYVANLTQAERDEIALNLNFDMIGSPNFVRFIYDGDGSDTVDGNGNPVVGPPGSEHIEQMYINHFVEKGLPVEPTLFSGRSDYGPFIAAGVDIPAGGLFTGAEGIKSQELADVYGGTVGAQFDPCYHEACDTYDNNSNEVLDQMIDAVAHSVAFYASRADLFAPIPALVPVSVTTGSVSMGNDIHDHDHDEGEIQ